MKEALGDKVDAVRLSKRLKSHPVCLASEGEVSLEMEKVLNAMPADNKVKARRVLEINENHPIFATLSGLLDTDPDKLRDYSELLYDQALLIEGWPSRILWRFPPACGADERPVIGILEKPARQIRAGAGFLRLSFDFERRGADEA